MVRGALGYSQSTRHELRLTMTKSLKSLLHSWQTAVLNTPHTQPPPYNDPDIAITHFTENTNEVTEGACFVARVRTTSDGHPWIGKAIEAGATLILGQHNIATLDIVIPDGVTYWQVPDTAETVAWLAAAWHDFPSRQLVTIGVTGTNGKTTSVEIIHTILTAAGLKAGMISTIKAIIGGEAESTGLHVSTPEAPAVQSYLRRMVEAGMTHCVLETTSHGLEQHRVTAVDFDIAAITNITHEHIDYHGTFEAYFAAKKRLFEMLQLGSWHGETANIYKQKVQKTAVLNRDDNSYEQLRSLFTHSSSVYPKGVDYRAKLTSPQEGLGEGVTLSYSLNQSADLTATDIHYAADGTHFQLQLHNQTTPITTHLVGGFNVQNLLASTAVCHALNINTSTIQKGIERVTAVSGRMQRIDRGQPFLVIVDFAHTHDALEKVIAAARGMGTGRIISLFGSAGKRDVEKRRLMAKASARDADLTILTAEDPRTEPLDDILAMMANGCVRMGGIKNENFWCIPDRGHAIYFALTLAQPEDIVLICGKGHEQSMCFGTTEFPWDDRDATIAALDAFLAQQPMVDLGLPTFQ